MGDETKYHLLSLFAVFRNAFALLGAMIFFVVAFSSKANSEDIFNLVGFFGFCLFVAVAIDLFNTRNDNE
jgi:hypothetical protein